MNEQDEGYLRWLIDRTDRLRATIGSSASWLVAASAVTISGLAFVTQSVVPEVPPQPGRTLQLLIIGLAWLASCFAIGWTLAAGAAANGISLGDFPWEPTTPALIEDDLTKDTVDSNSSLRKQLEAGRGYLRLATQRLRRAGFSLVLVPVLVVLSFVGRVAFQEQSGGPASQLSKEMIGTWVHVGRPGQVGEAPAEGGRLKFRTGTHWSLTRADPDTGMVAEHFGGTYTLKGSEYVETQDYGDATWMRDNGKSFKFTVTVEGDTMTQIGIGNPYTEVWKRVR